MDRKESASESICATRRKGAKEDRLHETVNKKKKPKNHWTLHLSKDMGPNVMDSDKDYNPANSMFLIFKNI